MLIGRDGVTQLHVVLRQLTERTRDVFVLRPARRVRLLDRRRGRDRRRAIVGATIGSFAWGWFSDRYGRRPGAFGFLGGAVAVLAYTFVLHDPLSLKVSGFV